MASPYLSLKTSRPLFAANRLSLRAKGVRGAEARALRAISPLAACTRLSRAGGHKKKHDPPHVPARGKSFLAKS
jgi:hypothetical protein